MFKYQGRNISYNSKGRGNTIVLLHGFTESLKIWDKFSEELSKNFQVISIDLVGHGETDVFSESHTMEQQADIVNAVLEESNVKDCVLVGHSMGGYVGLAIAEKYPEKIKGLVLFHSTAYADTEEKKKERLRTIEVVKANRNNFISDLIPKLFSPKNHESLKAEIEAMKELAKKTPSEGITAALLGMSQRKDRTEVLRSSDFPILFIAGKDDGVIPFEKILEQVTLPKRSQLLLLDKTGHMGFIEAEKESLYTLEGFSKMCFEV